MRMSVEGVNEADDGNFISFSNAINPADSNSV